ncbi:unnamed protein product, partial [Iphiclides podalirius]
MPLKMVPERWWGRLPALAAGPSSFQLAFTKKTTPFWSTAHAEHEAVTNFFFQHGRKQLIYSPRLAYQTEWKLFRSSRKFKATPPSRQCLAEGQTVLSISRNIESAAEATYSGF